MLALWIILGIIVSYIIGIVLFTILDATRMTLNKEEYFNQTFKQNLLDLLNQDISYDHQLGFCAGVTFWPFGILTCLILILFDLIDRTIIEKIREWCRK